MNVFYDELDISHFNQDKIYQSYSWDFEKAHRS
jgi:hypothetical protein